MANPKGINFLKVREEGGWFLCKVTFYAIIFFNLKDQRNFKRLILSSFDFMAGKTEVLKFTYWWVWGYLRDVSLFYFTNAEREGTFRYKEITLENIVA